MVPFKENPRCEREGSGADRALQRGNSRKRNNPLRQTLRSMLAVGEGIKNRVKRRGSERWDASRGEQGWG